MGPQIPLILNACIVFFGSTLARPYHRTPDEAVSSQAKDEGELRENFRNLLGSIANNFGQSEAFRDTLKDEVTREQWEFDSTKEKLRREARQNVRQKHFGAFKREINHMEKPGGATHVESTGTTSKESFSPSDPHVVESTGTTELLSTTSNSVQNQKVVQECLKKNGLPIQSDLEHLSKFKLGQIISCLVGEHENVQKEVRKFKGFSWKIVPRVFFDDIESLYKPRYDKYNDDRRNEEQKHKLDHVTRKMTDKPKYVPLHTTPADYPDGRDPRAVRMRLKYDFWDWLTTQHADDDIVKKILEKMEKKFRSMEKPPIPEERELTEEEKGELEKFRKKTCKAIGFASESASFILHGHQAVELFEGELEHLNIYGDEVDPYLVPVLNAVAPLTKEGVEPATFMKTE